MEGTTAATATMDSELKQSPPASSPSSSSKENSQKSKTGRSSLLGLNKTYQQLIHEAIVALKDRTGSSVPAISKHILINYAEHIQDDAHFRRQLYQALKQGVKQEHFTKIKCSYKISAAYKAKERNKKRRKSSNTSSNNSNTSKAALLAKTKASNAKKLQQLEEQQDLSPEEMAMIKQEMARKEEIARRKAQAEAAAKERADRLRRRRFPMEDTKLHTEDKELGVKSPALPRPYLPYFWTLPVEESSGGKTSSAILQASKVDGLDLGSNGLVPDLLQVYHFFRGDVHFWTGPDSEVYYPIVPEFSLKHLVFAVEQVMNGNARKSRMVPPLLCHLFVTCLQMLLLPPDATVADRKERKLRQELHDTLAAALSPASWAEVCTMYMDAMDRHYRTDSSRDPTVLAPLAIDLEYLMGVTDVPVIPMTPAPVKSNDGTTAESTATLPDQYGAYLGDPRCALHRAHNKLLRQDPWMLTAEEIMAILRALTDDILAIVPSVGDDIASRDEEMQELLKAKRAADAKFRKVRLAFEGPKKPVKKSSGDDKANGDNEKNGSGDKEEEPFKPTATKKQFESAKRLQQKASDAYEKGIRNLVSRTVPVGYDRNFNAVYCFRHDSEVLYVEDVRPAATTASLIPPEMQIQRRSWHVIETTSLFDRYTDSLDIRGRREHDLYEELLGPQGAQQSLRRYLYDDVKEELNKNAKKKELEALKKRLEVARVKCDEEQGRRSGRLAGQAEVEYIQIEEEVKDLEQEIANEKKKAPMDDRDYEELTGLALLRKFDSSGEKDQRRTREVKLTKERFIPLMNCSDICGTGNIDGTGLVGMMVSAMLEVEELCESLVPWGAEDLDSRSSWIGNLETAVHNWDSITPDLLGPPDTPRRVSLVSSTPVENGNSTPLKSDSAHRRSSLGSHASSVSKRRRLDSPSTPMGSSSVPSIISQLKAPLLFLEKRVADITNADVANRDADLADENMSTDGSDDDQAEKERLDFAWKRLLHKIRMTPTKRYYQIREMLVSAISAARKAHVPEVVSQLRAALLLHHPGAAGDCKNAAVKVLEKNGDYNEEDDEYAEEDEAEDEGNEKEEELPSVVPLEAVVLVSCLEGSQDASRSDWIESVKSVKTISRMAAIVRSFCCKAKEKLEKILRERDDLQTAIVIWEKQVDRKSKNGREFRADFEGPSEVWADVEFTDEICMVKAEKYPWWPARKCQAKDEQLANSIKRVQRTLVALVGEMGGLRIVSDDSIQPFTGSVIDSASDLPKDIRSQLNDCVAMARRMARASSKK